MKYLILVIFFFFPENSLNQIMIFFAGSCTPGPFPPWKGPWWLKMSSNRPVHQPRLKTYNFKYSSFIEDNFTKYLFNNSMATGIEINFFNHKQNIACSFKSYKQISVLFNI